MAILLIAAITAGLVVALLIVLGARGGDLDAIGIGASSLLRVKLS